ncbi:MAG: hypothetical protein Tsb0034_26740 [Ekhidna sp.]
MSISISKSPNATKLWFENEMIYLLLEDGRELGVPKAWFPKLIMATESELNNWRFIGGGDGIHWPDLDEDISVESLLYQNQ